MGLNGLVPARFLTLTAHLVISINILWDVVDQDDLDTDLVIGLSVALGLLVLEFVGFLGGFSMFLPSQGLISTAAHASAVVTLAYFYYDDWDSWTFWYIFAFCSALPGLTEIMVLVGVLVMNKSL